MKKIIFAVIGVCCLMLSTQAFATSISEDSVDFLATYTSSGWTIDKNIYDYDDPQWQNNFTKLYVDNQEVPDWTKTVWLEIDFKDLRTRGPASTIPIFSLDGVEDSNAYGLIDSSDTTIVSWTWTISPQPASETIDFTNNIWNFQNMTGIESIAVATQCVPEPSTFVLLVFGFLGILAGNKLRRKS